MGWASTTHVLRGPPELISQLWGLANNMWDGVDPDDEYRVYYEPMRELEDEIKNDPQCDSFREYGVKYATRDQVWDIVGDWPLDDAKAPPGGLRVFRSGNQTELKHLQRKQEMLKAQQGDHASKENADPELCDGLKREPGLQSPLSLPTLFNQDAAISGDDWVLVQDPAAVLPLMQGDAAIETLRAGMER